MDLRTVVETLKATLSPQLRQQAEDQLSQFCKSTGFIRCLMSIILNEEIEISARQAGAIYLKNHVNTYWTDYNELTTTNDSNSFMISNTMNLSVNTSKKLFVIDDVDKEYLRTVLIDAIIQTKDPLRCQLITTASTMIRNDFPLKWSQFIHQIHSCLNTDNVKTWHSVLLVFYTLVQHYEYKKVEDRAPIDEVMRVLLPLLHQRLIQLFTHDDSDQSALIQKQILKIFYSYTQIHLNLRVISNQSMTDWLNTCCTILERCLPSRLDKLDEDDRPEHPWWKCKKWSLHILNRTFEIHGCPSKLSNESSPEQSQFANFYLKTFSSKVIGLIFSVLESYRQKNYISPRVLQLALGYLRESIHHTFSWKIMQNNMVILIQDVIYPLLCISDTDLELFNDEPIEYIRTRLDIMDEYPSPMSAAEIFLADAASKRKEILMKTVSFIGTIINNDQISSKQKDGILHMLGVIGKTLIKRKDFTHQLENMIVQYIFPQLRSSIPFLRARACYALQNFAKLKYENCENSVHCLNHIIHCLCNDPSLPVQVEAAMALNLFISEISTPEYGKSVIVSNLQMIVMKIIEIIRQTEIEDVMIVLQKIVNTYDQELQPIAIQITSELVQFFKHVVCSENTSKNENKTEERTIAAMGVLNTLDTIVSCMGRQQDILNQIQHIIYDAINLVLGDGILDFYEETFTLIDTLTMSMISPLMWQVFYVIKEAFFRDAADYFAEIMSCLHNYVVNDTPAFLSHPDRLETVFEMCKHVIINDLGEDTEAHAAKLIEVVTLQCQDRITMALPAIVQLIAQRFQREIVTNELRLMLLQVFIVILWLNPDRFFQTMATVAANDPGTQTVLANFFNQWMHDCELFVGTHDRRVCALGLCTLLRIDAKYYSAISSIVPRILPNCIRIYQGLMKAYEHQHERHNNGDTDNNEDSPLSDTDEKDQQEIDKLGNETRGQAMNAQGSDDDSEHDNSDLDFAETDLESFSTVLEGNSGIDEFQIFCVSLQQLQSDTTGYNQALLQSLTMDQRAEIQKIIHFTEKRGSLG